ncbi:MAG: hypothetical protein HOL38_03860 [Verrucomicrobia bacterium]|nr:hypothetical protein [Verrucomicrobiota bacterium]
MKSCSHGKVGRLATTSAVSTALQQVSRQCDGAAAHTACRSTARMHPSSHVMIPAVF